MNPIISIIMPVYNAGKTVTRMVDSILAQSFTKWELIAVDDGSTDNSGEILDAYAVTDSRIKVFHKPNGGVASARQMGIENATGIYTIHADSDDYVEPSMLKEMLESAVSENADIVISDYYTETINGRTQLIIQKPSSLEPIEVLKALYAKGLFGGLWHKLIKRSTYDKAQARFIPGIDYCEDLLVLTKLLIYAEPKIAYLPKAYYHYVVNPNSLTQRVSAKGLLSMKRFHAETSKIIPNNNDFNRIKQNFAVNEFLVYFKNRLYGSARELHEEYSKTKLYINSDIGLRWKLGYWCIEHSFIAIAHWLISF